MGQSCRPRNRRDADAPGRARRTGHLAGDRTGTAAVEYALIIGAIGAAVMLAARVELWQPTAAARTSSLVDALEPRAPRLEGGHTLAD
ncbi:MULTISPECIES: hypothetical protein [unclassified Roseitalea]|uniref:hypothetical protein n=1 Tax=unclassified Roseitalea TaxID=2639107 RepID=UPI00273DA76E|nr:MULTISPECIES: hypothetical protein [unclassified Roseitalea]